MKNGKFTKDEREYLRSLDAVTEVSSKQIIYSDRFKKDFIKRYKNGESPSKIFADAGMSSQLIGYKRIERACARWKRASNSGYLGSAKSPVISRRNRIETLKKEKSEAIKRQRAIREKRIKKLEDKLKKQKENARKKQEKIIASQRAEIERLKSQVKALKANGTLARTSRRAPGTTEKSERFELIFQLKSKHKDLVISAACEVLEVSKSGYYEYVKAKDKREERMEEDRVAEEIILAAYQAHGVKKGSRLVVDTLRREFNIFWSRKKVMRHMRALKISGFVKRKRPFISIGTDGEPKVAKNIVDRHFMTGRPLAVLSTDITYLPCSDAKYVYVSAVIDCETRRILAHCCSTSMEEKLVIETQKQLKKFKLADGVIEQSDQGSHYTAREYREILKALDIRQSMSKRGCCHDNAPIESFWGRMKEQIGDTKNLSSKEVIEKVEKYIDYYNNKRGQERLGNLTPVEYERKLLAS